MYKADWITFDHRYMWLADIATNHIEATCIRDMSNYSHENTCTFDATLNDGESSVPGRWIDSDPPEAGGYWASGVPNVVELFFEFGYIGVVLLIGFLGSLLFAFLKAVKTKEFVLYSSCVLAYLLNSIGNFCSQIAVSGLLFILFLGMFYGTRRENGTASR